MQTLPSLFEEVETEHFNALLDMLLPSVGNRLSEDFEIEFECEDDTFTLLYENEIADFRTGFAEDDPFASIFMTASFYDFVRPFLERVLKGEMDASLATNLRSISSKEAKVSYDSLSKLEGLRANLAVPGAGSFSVALGPLDEAVDEMNFVLQKAELEAIFNNDLSALSRVRPTSGAMLLPKILGAMTPIVRAFKR